MRPSSPDERAEFIELMQALGAGSIRGDRGEQTIRCWNRQAHSRGDRTPSLAVNPQHSVWHCHGCGKRGGLTDLRRLMGRDCKQRSRTRHKRASEHLRLLAAPGSNVLEHIPPAAIEDLRERTGRHKRDHILNRNLRLMVAILVDRIDAEQSTRRVEFGQIEAVRRGMRAQTWSQLLHLLEHLGIEIERGQSGRCIRSMAEGRGKDGALAVTLATIRDNPLSTSTAPLSSGISRVIPNGAEMTIAASLATKAPSDLGSPTLSGSPAMAELLASFGTVTAPRPATGGTGGDVVIETLTIGDLVAVHGKRIRRTLRRAETLGLVNVLRPTTKRDKVSRFHGLVCLTALGEETLQRDHLAGAERMEERANKQQQAWMDYQQRLAETIVIEPFDTEPEHLHIDPDTGEIIATSTDPHRAPLRSPSDSTAHRADAITARKLVPLQRICGVRHHSMTAAPQILPTPSPEVTR